MKTWRATSVDQVYYRLHQVDADGSSTYSPVWAVPSGAGLLLQRYPNPRQVADKVTVLIRADQAAPAAPADTSVTTRLKLPSGLPPFFSV